MKSFEELIRSPHRSGNINFSIEKRHKDYVLSRMPVSEGILNPFGTVQAGAMVWLADVTATLLAIGDRSIGPKGEGFPLAVDLHISLLANQKDGDIKAESRFVRNGKRLIVIRTRITGNEDKLLAELTSTHIPAQG